MVINTCRACICICIYMYAYIHLHMFMYIYMYIYMCRQIYICTKRQINVLVYLQDLY